MGKVLPEFQMSEDPEWAQERYLEDLHREAMGARDRGDKDAEQAALDQIARVSGKKKTAAKRPAEASESR